MSSGFFSSSAGGPSGISAQEKRVWFDPASVVTPAPITSIRLENASTSSTAKAYSSARGYHGLTSKRSVNAMTMRSYEPKAAGCAKTLAVAVCCRICRAPLKSPEASNGLIGSNLKYCLSPLVLRHKNSGATFAQILWRKIKESRLCIDINLVLQKKAKGVQLTFRFND